MYDRTSTAPGPMRNPCGGRRHAVSGLPGRRRLPLAGALWWSFWALANVIFPCRGRSGDGFSTLHVDRDGAWCDRPLSRRQIPPAPEVSPTCPRGWSGFPPLRRQTLLPPSGVNPSRWRGRSSNAPRARADGRVDDPHAVAKLMEPKRRTLGGESGGDFRAFQLEHAYTKDALLELYLNSVPMGGNIEGVGPRPISISANHRRPEPG